MRIIDILNECTFEKIKAKIILHYGLDRISNYNSLYYELKNKKINYDVNPDFYIYIIAYKVTDDDDTSLYFDVSGYDPNEQLVYSIVASSYSIFLQYKVSEKTLKNF